MITDADGRRRRQDFWPYWDDEMRGHAERDGSKKSRSRLEDAVVLTRPNDIVVGVDGFRCADFAAEVAAREASLRTLNLFLVRVISWSRFDLSFGPDIAAKESPWPKS